MDKEKIRVENLGKTLNSQNRNAISVDTMRRASGLARPYFLSVRLSKRELEQYATMLQWYELEFDDKVTSASDRFRTLLSSFCDGLQLVEGISEEALQYLIRRPPDWKSKRL